MKTLFDKISIANTPVKNRFIRSATWLALASEQGHLSKDFMKFQKAICQGGVGTYILEFSRINSEDMPFNGMPNLSDDKFIADFAELADCAHQNNTAIFAQIGQSAYNILSDKILINRDVNTATIPEIKSMVDEFAKAAKRAELAGFDGVQIHAAHGFLLSRFLSGLYNSRRDRYGKTFEKRANVILEIISAIRKTCAANFCIAIKIDSSNEGFSEDESFEICKILDGANIDLIEVSGADASRKRSVNFDKESYFKDFATRLAANIKAPVALVGGNRSIDSMEEILNSSKIEFFSLSRPLIREPNLVNRWLSGDRRPSKCVSCNSCFQTIGHRCVYEKFDAKLDVNSAK